MDIGVIGTGMMGRNHARIFSEMKSVDTLSVFDLNRKAAEEIAGATGARAIGSLDDLLSSVDAVSICVPTRFHFDVARQVAEHDIPMLIEKPVCQTVAEADELAALLPGRAMAGVGHIERFNPVVNEILRISKRPLYVEIKRHNPASARVTEGSVVEDLMIHDIDIVFNLLFRGSWDLFSTGNADVCTALIRFGSVPVYLSASRKASKKIRSIYIEEEDFTIEGDLMSQEVFVYRKPNRYAMENSRYVQDNIIEKVLINKTESLRAELNTFVSCVREHRPFPITVAEARKNMQVCEYILGQAMANNPARPIPVAT